MYRYAAASIVFAMLAGCQGENPLYFNDPEEVVEETTEETVEETAIDLSDLENNLTTAVYDPDTETLYVDMYALDRVGNDYPLVEYNRAADLDVPGYYAFNYQDDPLDRYFIAYVAQTPDGTAQGTIVADGGQFTEYFGGTQMFARQEYSAGPEVGLVSYAGDYVGITNLTYYGDELLVVPAPYNSDEYASLWPTQPIIVEGEAFINVDFGDNAINGAIVNRQFTLMSGYPEDAFEGTTYGVNDLILQPGTVDESGQFTGTVVGQVIQEVGTDPITVESYEVGEGTYGGVLAGDGATGMAGGLFVSNHIDPIDGREIELEEEYGIFVLTQCGLPDDAAICDIVNP
ncbi:hypothetical protein BVC71_11275 [Marivivens niveibacter]|uniref:Thymidylate synthase n=1 Tax=Marivivens niveibacter TaxID=1930667 RepID=A0A251WXQ2_9RHOB|nr:hypothetical protein [Marivivens niveibacter]OUD09270.1 hypothetical protein BVC71_11275 [Marivivens niveibacter]